MAHDDEMRAKLLEVLESERVDAGEMIRHQMTLRWATSGGLLLAYLSAAQYGFDRDAAKQTLAAYALCFALAVVLVFLNAYFEAAIAKYLVQRIAAGDAMKYFIGSDVIENDRGMSRFRNSGRPGLKSWLAVISQWLVAVVLVGAPSYAYLSLVPGIAVLARLALAACVGGMIGLAAVVYYKAEENVVRKSLCERQVRLESLPASLRVADTPAVASPKVPAVASAVDGDGST
jgi:hypothetical protein